jgi:hypothetical protein
MWNPQGSRKRGRPRNSWQRSTLTEAGKRSWEKELEGVEIYCQRQEEMEGTRRQPVFLMEQLFYYYCFCCYKFIYI